MKRHTDDILGAVGDIGGVYEMLYLIFSIIVTGYANTTLKSQLANYLYSQLAPDPEDKRV